MFPMSIDEVFHLATHKSQPKYEDFAFEDSGTFWRGFVINDLQIHNALMYNSGLRNRYFMVVRGDDYAGTGVRMATGIAAELLIHRCENFSINVNNLYTEREIDTAMITSIVTKKTGLEFFMMRGDLEIPQHVVERMLPYNLVFRTTRSPVVYVKCNYSFNDPAKQYSYNPVAVFT